MDIKATQLKNNPQITETASTSVRIPAKPTDEGKSFVDAMSDLPKIDADNSAVKNVSVELENKADINKDNKSFEFVSKSDKDFKFNQIQNKECMTLEERQAKHKVAEKELVDEIVLMNNKHNSDIKNLDKNEFKNAAKSEKFNQKSDKLMDAENFDVKSDIKNAAKSEKLQAETVNQKSDKQIDAEIFDVKSDIKFAGKPENVQEENVNDLEFVKSDMANKDVDILQQNVIEPEVLKIAEGEVEEILLPDKNVKTEIFPQPETLEKFEDPKNIENKEPVVIEQVVKDDKVEVIGKLANEEIKDKNIMPKALNIEEKSLNVKTENLKDNKVNAMENSVKPEKVSHEKTSRNDSNVESIKVQKVNDIKVQKNEDIKTQKTEIPKIKEVEEKSVVQAVKQPEQTEKVAFVESLINQNKIDEKKNLKNDKPSLSKISNVKKDILNDVENVGKVKDIANEVKVSNVEMKPAVPQDIKVIKMEVINPLAELNNSMNTNKTSDIVKFIDANLSTDTVKTAKSRSTKSSEAAKKSSEKSIKMTEADAKFFNNLIEANQQVIEGTKTAEQANNNLLKDVETAKAAQVSKTLLNALKESQENNKAFRVDFDKDISVVLRVNKDGQISAEFIPGDEAVEQYLKANIPLLKQKFSDEGLEYDNLSYRQHKKDNEEKERQNKGNKKENGYE